MEFGQYKYPVFQVPAGKSLDDILRKHEKGWKNDSPDPGGGKDPSPEEVHGVPRKARIRAGVIIKMGFAGYFLIVADFIEYARRPISP